MRSKSQSHNNSSNNNTVAKYRRRWATTTSLLVSALLVTTTHSFAPNTAAASHPLFRVCLLMDKISPNLDQEIDKDIQRARALLEKTKAKLEAKQQPNNQDDNQSLPFFATSTRSDLSRDGLVKSINETTGLIRADGERMAQISESEDWEMRKINEVFENEIQPPANTESLNRRDVAASIWNLRQQLHTEDYRKIFDKRNRFIGEDN